MSIAICVKDEADYLIEWLEYHLLLGVEHFYIYNNNGTDNSYELLIPYIARGLVTWIEYPGLQKQREIYNHAIKRYKNETFWLGFIDIDEFIIPLKDKDISALMKKYEKYAGLAIHWFIYGSSNMERKTDGLVIERFKYRDINVNWQVKSIVNPRLVLKADIHFSYTLKKLLDENGRFVGSFVPKPYTAETIRINHYIVKSKEEFLRKQCRGDAVYNTISSDYFKVNDKNDVYDYIMEPFVYELQKRISHQG